MSHAILHAVAADIDALPVFAQVLLASRLARRATLWLAGGGHESFRGELIAACDAVERCTLGAPAVTFVPPSLPFPAGILPFIVEACARASLAAGCACQGDCASCSAHVHASLAASLESPGFNKLQGSIFLAGDLSLISWVCTELRIGHTQRLTQGVLERLTPVHPPDQVPPPHVEFDPTFGAR